MSAFFSVLLLLQINSLVLENDYVRVHRNDAPCASAEAECGDRVIVALGTMNFEGSEMRRGDVRVFSPGESYSAPQDGEFVEVVVKTERPDVRTPAEIITVENYNVILYEGERYRVMEGRLRPGDARARHSHNQRLIIVLNRTRLRQQTEGQPEVLSDFIPDNISFGEPVIHVMENVGNQSLRNIVIELKP